MAENKKVLRYGWLCKILNGLCLDSEVDAAMQQLVSFLEETFGAQLPCLMEKTKMTSAKAELADLLFERCVGLNKRESKDMVEAFFEIRNSLETSDGVKLSGFGNFQLQDKPQRRVEIQNWSKIPIARRGGDLSCRVQRLKSDVRAHVRWNYGPQTGSVACVIAAIHTAQALHRHDQVG